MSVGAGGAEGAVALSEGFAEGAGGVESEAVFTFKEVGKGELVSGRGSGRLVIKVSGGGRLVSYGDGHDACC